MGTRTDLPRRYTSTVGRGSCRTIPFCPYLDGTSGDSLVPILSVSHSNILVLHSRRVLENGEFQEYG